jgi:hypothetical protein
MRSVRAIRLGNEHDEKDFHEREQDRLEPKQKKDVRLSMFDAAPWTVRTNCELVSTC